MNISKYWAGLSKTKRSHGLGHKRILPGGNPIHPAGRRDVPWITLPERLSAMEVLNGAVNRKVAFVPGDPFYVNKIAANTLRLNFSSVVSETSVWY